jgi:hypothetical protein
MQSAHYIPFRKQDIVTICSHELPKETQSYTFNPFCNLLASIIHFDYHSTPESLKNNDAPFDPNSDTHLLNKVTLEQKSHSPHDFAKDFANVLNAANFEVITHQDLQKAFNEESLLKVRLEVEFDDFEKVIFLSPW